jgi:hypothetical protein
MCFTDISDEHYYKEKKDDGKPSSSVSKATYVT